jgi:hypothetical protein
VRMGCGERWSGARRWVPAAMLWAGLALLPGTSRAAHEFEKVGTIGVQFLKMSVGARGESMGTAFCAIADDASAVYWNPAGLARLDGRLLALNQTQWIADIKFFQATYIDRLRFLPGTFALHVRSVSMPEDKVRTVFRPDGEGTSFDAGDLAIGLSYARSLTDKFCTGVGMNFVQSTLATYTGHAITFDFGTLYDTGFHAFKIGMVIQNIGSDLTFLEQPVKVPTIFRVGMSTVVFEQAGQKLLCAGEFSHPPDNAERANVGAEYSVRDLIFVRGGWFWRFDSERLSAGAGIRLPRIVTRETRVDYAYTEMRDLPAVQRISVEFRL